MDVDAEVARLEAMDDERLLSERCGKVRITQREGMWSLKQGRDEFPMSDRSEAIASFVLALTSNGKAGR